MSWDGFQREVLAELGLAVYALAGADAPEKQPPASSAQSHPAPSPASGRGGQPLYDALLRAAGIESQDAQTICREFLAANPNPSAKARRTLWPKLRRLRAHKA